MVKTKMIKIKKDTVKDNISKEIASQKEEIASLTLNWKRALADYQNLERRTQDEKVGLSRFATKELLKKLLPVLDTLENANDNIKDEGLTLVIKQFTNVLKEEGVSEINTNDADFDPHKMECISLVEGDMDNKVAQTLEKGYLLGDQILRPAKVTVAKHIAEKTVEETTIKENQN